MGSHKYLFTGILLAAIVVVAIFVYSGVGTNSAERTGTETLTAEQVVDLEVQAQQEYEASGGTY